MSTHTYSYKCECNKIFDKIHVKIDDRDIMPYCECGKRAVKRVINGFSNFSMTPWHTKEEQ